MLMLWLLFSGSGRYGDDIMSYRQHGDRNFAKHVFHELTISSGSSIYISVTGGNKVFEITLFRPLA